MAKLNHPTLAVKDYRATRDWYLKHIGLKLEFEVPRRRAAALNDDSGNTLILEEIKGRIGVNSCILYFEVDDVEGQRKRLSAIGVAFVHPPSRRSWGYGAELRDPSGYRIRLWDRVTMNEKG
jgi:catechol 2,3-dioxygenase-like lactoylglutathione lyase family enzyme